MTEDASKAPTAKWVVEFHDEFLPEFRAMDREGRKALLAAASALSTVGPTGGRPLVGTLHNPKHPNMKELRYDAANGTQVWRAAFAFDPARCAIVLVAGEKQGLDEKSFYKVLIGKANKRLDKHLKTLTATGLRKPKR